MSKATFQDWLDTVGAAFFQANFDAYERAVLLPMTIATQTSVLKVSDRTALRRGFDTWVHMLKTYEVTDMIRLCRNVKVVDATHMTGDYQTEILAHGQRVVPPFTSTMTLEKRDGWRATHVISGMTGQIWPPAVPGFERQTPSQTETTFTKGTSNE